MADLTISLILLPVIRLKYLTFGLLILTQFGFVNCFLALLNFQAELDFQTASDLFDDDEDVDDGTIPGIDGDVEEDDDEDAVVKTVDGRTDVATTGVADNTGWL